MLRFLLRRLLFALVLVLVSSSAALLLTRAAPGDVTFELGPFASRSEVEQTRAAYDLDRSPLGQWTAWLGRAARFDFGRSFLYGRPVGPLIAAAAGHTALLAAAALLVATVSGVWFGLLTGSRRGAMVLLVRAASLVCVSVPPLVTSLVLLFVAARTGWLPVGGLTSAADHVSWGAWMSDVAWHLPLPALALALPIAGTFERLQAQALAEALAQPFVTAAVARGVPPSRVIRRHAWPVSVRPLCAIYGIAMGTLLSGSFVVEFVTAWPGLGRLMYEALRARDVYLVAGCAATGAGLLALGTLVGDLLLALADPRVRERGDA